MLAELLPWLLDDAWGRDKLALLVLCVLSISVLAAQLRWRLGRGSAREGDAGTRSWVRRWLLESVRALFCLGLPLGVLWQGALVREMGFPSTLIGPSSLPRGDGGFAWSGTARWLAGLELADAQALVRLGSGVAVGGGALLVLVAIWIWYARVVLRPAGLALGAPPAIPWWEAVRQALLSQFLWAFYRGFAWSVVPDRAQAALLALALISVPWALDPQHRRDLFTSRGYTVVQTWLLALFTVVVSLATNMLWFLVLMHTLWVWSSGRLLSHLSERAAREAGVLAAS
jgi:hypothetical protein